MHFTAQELATILQAEVEGDPSVRVNRPSKIEEGGEGSISFLGNPKYEPHIYETTASVVLVERSFEARRPVSSTLIRVDNVREAFARLLSFYDAAIQQRPSGVSPQAFVDPEARLGENVAVGRFTTVEKGAVLGDGVILFDGVYVGANAQIGAGSILYPGARVMHQCSVGQRCVIKANAVIGGDGFGFAPDEQGVYQKIPQVGVAILEDDVEIGSNTTIDRATMGATRIGKGCKIDNLVQIAHNVEIGAHTVIAAQAGIAGSTKIGQHCLIGGQVGIIGHLNIADGTQFQAQSGVGINIKEPNQAFFGTPAIGYRDYIRSYGVFKQLPDLYKRLHKLEKMVQNGQHDPSSDPDA
ncbi:MAG: UDP-3-O-(3-hydroxymyristoyl)glucosamine N-acyltransferase [Lewinella sp.]|nr:UDP-3-O-(3-hydroxymyristoyl)glucosamine N-acyltransferase [Lewinella sp.]